MTPNATSMLGGNKWPSFNSTSFVSVFGGCHHGSDSKNTNLLQCEDLQACTIMLLVPRFPRYQLMLHNDREQQGWSKL
ncbi:hypothetical protein Plhal703r1_c06g0031101 [Plasmopara halstedii]